MHGSLGKRGPASEHLKSELAIVAGLAKATLPAHPKWRWDEWTGDYGLVRALIAATYPDEFHDMSDRMFEPGGFYRGNKARERIWKTASGKAEFTAPTVMSACGIGDAPGRFHLVTMRSNDQFNTTIYGHSDRLRGLEGSRAIVLVSPADMTREGLAEGDVVTLFCDADDGVPREVGGLTVTPFALPDGCVGGYYPETERAGPAVVSRRSLEDAGIERCSGAIPSILCRRDRRRQVASRVVYIDSFTPIRISHQLTGYAVTKPAIIASCIANQNSGWSTRARSPNCSGNQASCANAMKPYMPTCHAASDRANRP